MENVYIFGHKNPDTDSVTSAIALEYLKKITGLPCEARVLGMINDETKYILDRFNFEYPKYLQDVKLQISDIMYHKDLMIYDTSSIEDLYNYLEEYNITGVPVVDFNKTFISIITSKMALKDCFKEDFGNVFSSYFNIVKVLKGEKILEFDNEIKGKCTIYKEQDDLKDNDIFIVNDISLVNQLINNKVKLLVINFDLNEELLSLCMNNRINVIKTSFNLYEARKKIKLGNYVSTIINNERTHIVYEDDYYDDFIRMSESLGHNNYPVVNKENKCLGLLRITDIKNKKRKQVILVDHNESAQSINGLDEAEILEIFDHHKIGDLSTKNPINFRTMTVGSTNTIIYILYKEARINIPKDIASIMLGGIISDTLALTSPTTTDIDREIAKNLENLTGLNLEEYAKDIFNASIKIEENDEMDLIKQDLKTFEINQKTYKISQITLLDATNFITKKEILISKLNKIKIDTESEFVLLFVVDILKHGSYLFYNDDERTRNYLERSFSKTIYEGVFLKDIISRKLQIVPLLIDNY